MKKVKRLVPSDESVLDLAFNETFMVHNIVLGKKVKSRYLKKWALLDTDYMFCSPSCTAFKEQINEKSCALMLSVLSLLTHPDQIYIPQQNTNG